MPIDYSYLPISQILAKIALIDEALDGGSQTSVGIEPRISHQFAGKSDAELRIRRDEYAFALFNIAQASGDPAKIALYKNPYNRAGITRANFGSQCGWTNP